MELFSIRIQRTFQLVSTVTWLFMQGFTTKYDLSKAEVEILS